jgi:uncharacterized protein
MLVNRRILAALLAAGLLAAAGCSKSAEPAPSDSGSGVEPMPSVASSSAALPASPTSAPDTAAPEGPPVAPPGYVAMKVMDVVPTSQGNAVLLTDEAEERVIPIFVGGTEALSIELRLSEKRYARPLTHDLLDALVGKLGGELVKVQVDELRSSVFVGSVFVKQGGKLLSVDARPSDAIALALGRRAPIFVASKVLDVSGIKKRDLMRDNDEPDRVRLPPSPPEPMAL